MKKLVLLIMIMCFALHGKATNYADYVNPLIGTQSTYEFSSGNTYPAIARPWGMNFWTPQTGKMGDGWQYMYTATKIRGFKQTHQPSPWINDYGQFSIMPVVGEPVFDENKRASWFSHKGEEAKAYYYKVYLAEHDVVTELVPTERAALFRFTFPENEHSYVVIDAFDKGSYVKIDAANNRIIGYSTKNSGGVPDNFKNYFVIEFDKPFTYKATVADSCISVGKAEQEANHAGAIIGFVTRKGEKVHARVASSFISQAQALENLKELGNDSFDVLVEKGKTAWNEAYGPDNDPKGYGKTAREAVNEVRNRSGVRMPAVEVPIGDIAAMRKAIKHERRIELAFEDHRYWDLKRWDDAKDVLNEPIRGVKVTRKVENEHPIFSYNEYEVSKRVFVAPKMNLYPIPQSEIVKSGNVLVQNPNW